MKSFLAPWLRNEWGGSNPPTFFSWPLINIQQFWSYEPTYLSCGFHFAGCGRCWTDTGLPAGRCLRRVGRICSPWYGPWLGVGRGTWSVKDPGRSSGGISQF
jgi:hypothetical protein